MTPDPDAASSVDGETPPAAAGGSDGREEIRATRAAEENPRDPHLLDRLNASLGELNQRMGIRLTRAEPGRLEGSMPVAGNRQPAGLLHGGANVVLAETLGSMHAMVLAPVGTIPVGIEVSCSHHRSVTDGEVLGSCVPVQTGRTLAGFEIVLTDPAGRRTATARLTCLYRPIPDGDSRSPALP